MSRFKSIITSSNLIFEVKPCKNVGSIVFGMSRNDVRKLFNNKFTEFSKTKSSSATVDDFSGVHVYYNTKNKVEYVEIFNGTVTYNGVTIFPGKENNLIKTLSCSFTNNINKTYNISYEADNGELKSIGFGGPGYYK